MITNINGEDMVFQNHYSPHYNYENIGTEKILAHDIFGITFRAGKWLKQ